MGKVLVAVAVFLALLGIVKLNSIAIKEEVDKCEDERGGVLVRGYRDSNPVCVRRAP